MDNTYNHENDTVITPSDARKNGSQVRLRASTEGSAAMFRRFSFWPVTALKPTQDNGASQNQELPPGKDPVRRVSFVRKMG
jgi:hypothetical protein